MGRVSTASKLLSQRKKSPRGRRPHRGSAARTRKRRRSPCSCKRRRIGPTADGAVWLGVGPGSWRSSMTPARRIEIYDRLAADDRSESLVLHGLHPLNVETRIARALDRVRPYLGSHGGDVKLLVNGGRSSLAPEGSCHGCPSSTVTMKLAIEKAIEEAAPEVMRIEVEGASPAASAASERERRCEDQPNSRAGSRDQFGRVDRSRPVAGVHRGKSCQHNIGGDERSFVQGRRDILRLSGLLPVLRFGAGRKRAAGEPVNLFFL